MNFIADLVGLSDGQFDFFQTHFGRNSDYLQVCGSIVKFSGGGEEEASEKNVQACLSY